MKAWDVVGYTFEADVYCPECVLEEMGEETCVHTPTETLLTRIAKARGIDYADEASYDSGDFPKVIFASGDEGEHCARCHQPLIESVFDEPTERE